MLGTVPSAKLRLAQAIGDLVAEAAENRLVDFGGLRIYDAPLVGVADGEDPVFSRFQEVVSPRHLMPRPLLEEAAGSRPQCVRVVVWVLPFSEAVRKSNRGRRWPSRLYSLARNNGGALNYRLRQQVAEMLQAEGRAAVAPLLADSYDAFRSPEHVFTSTWSERHAAFAAGLGRFGLNRALITPRGSFVRIGSVVTDLPVEPTARLHADHRAPCLASGGELCGECVARCPTGAISSVGMDKRRCYEMRGAVRKRFLRDYVRLMEMLPAPVSKSGRRERGYSLGCALCMCGVPCEGRDPFAESAGGERCST